MSDEEFLRLLAANWQVALLVRHFLSARRQRDLVSVVCREATGGSVNLDDLVEEVIEPGRLWSETWLVRPRERLSGYEASLQTWVRSVVWQNDQGGAFSDREGDSEGNYLSGNFLDQLISCASSDFGWPLGEMTRRLGPFKSHHQDSLTLFLQAHEECHKHGRTEGWQWQAVEKTLMDVPFPFRALCFKHLADLFVDSDLWTPGLNGYQLARSSFHEMPDEGDLAIDTKVWLDLTVQSICLGLEVTESRGKARIFAEEHLGNRTLTSDPVVAANFGLDATNRRESILSEDWSDLRPSLMSAPLLHYNHELDSALGHWREEKYDDASSRFWSHLRRLIALGSTTQTRRGKQYYASCIFERMIRGRGSIDLESFQMATRLLVESERADAVKLIPWTSEIVERFVVPGSACTILEAAKRYPGVARRRIRVVVEMFGAWGPLLSSSHEPTIVALWVNLAKITTEYPGEFSNDVDIGRGALRGLKALAEARPEMICQVAEPVTDALVAKASEEFLWSPEEAARTSLAYAQDLPDANLVRVATAILARLEEQEPGEGAFTPFIRGALRLLVDPRVREVMSGDRPLSRRVLDQILRFGTGPGQQSLVFFHLADFDESLLVSDAVVAQLKIPLEDAMRGALESNASSVTNHIRALLVAPTAAGPEGLCAALQGIVKILNSVTERHVSLGLANVDGCIFELVHSLAKVRQVFGEDGSVLEVLLASLSGSLQVLWEAAEAKPTVLAEFAFPPKTRANPVVVHNLAFASLKFGAAVNRLEDIKTTLVRASAQDELAGPISLAHATYALDINDPRVIDGIEGEDRSSFYSALGRRVAIFNRQSDRVDLGRRLLAGVLRHGPDARDLVVLSLAMQFDLFESESDAFKSYFQRVRNTRDLSLLLRPTLDLARKN